MCRFCDWDEDLAGRRGAADPQAAAEAAAARRRLSQDSWARLMDEIAQADAQAQRRGGD